MGNKQNINLFVLGGAKSGKSDYALSLAEQSNLQKVYIATAQSFDQEMKSKIQAHQNQRNTTWQTIEEPIDLAQAIVNNANNENIVLVDCLTLWLSNIILAGKDIDSEIFNLLETISAVQSPVIFVSNEVGMGLVAETPLGRKFRDRQGLLNKKLAGQIDSVVLMCAGIAIPIKGTPIQQ